MAGTGQTLLSSARARSNGCRQQHRRGPVSEFLTFFSACKKAPKHRYRSLRIEAPSSSYACLRFAASFSKSLIDIR